MTTHETDICNLALGHLGEGRIQAANGESVISRACDLHYARTRDQVLRAHRWNFAQKRTPLEPVNPAASFFGWAYQYQLKTDCLRVIEFNGVDVEEMVGTEFIIEGDKLLTNANVAKIVYIGRIEDATMFDALFIKALALLLAAHLSETVRGTTGKTEELLRLYESVVAPLAMAVNDTEGRRVRGRVRDALLRSHRWNFAQKRVALEALEDAPAFGWAYQYELPADCLRVLEVNGTEGGELLGNEFIVEGNKLLTDAPAVNLIYTSRVTDPAKFDPLFVAALELKIRIAREADLGKAQALEMQYERITGPLARRVDANEGRRRKGLLPMNSLALRARGAGENLEVPNGRAIIVETTPED